MSVRLLSVVMPLLAALLCASAAPASAERPDDRQRDARREEPRDGRREDPRSGELRSRYERERHEQERRQREAAPSRGFPQPGISPNQYRHDPYSRQPNRTPNRYDQSYGQTQRQEPERNRGYDSPGRPLRPVNDVVRQVEGSYGGKVVGVQQEGDHYRVRVLQRDGRVRTVTVPAR